MTSFGYLNNNEVFPVSLMSRSLAEMIGTFWLVLGGCGSAALAAVFMAGTNDIGIGLLGVALAFGLTVVTMAYAIGHISGCHLNPAVTIGLVAGGRFQASEAPMYIIFQTIGAILAAFLLLLILQGSPTFTLSATSLAVNGFGDLSPGKYGMVTGFITEVLNRVGEGLLPRLSDDDGDGLGGLLGKQRGGQDQQQEHKGGTSGHGDRFLRGMWLLVD